jgi:hypothetical protein
MRKPMRGGIRPLVVCVVSVTVAALCVRPGRSDVVTLSSGGEVRGTVVSGTSASSSKPLSIVTGTGAVITFSRDTVLTVQRGAGAGPKSVAAPTRVQLTPEEQAWMPKISGLAARLFDSDSNQSRRAGAELSRIEDRAAIPALTKYLARSSIVEARRLYIAIVKNLPGPTPAYYLVALSLFDPSSTVRDDARKAIIPDKAEAARVMYIEALKTRNSDVASRAAKGIAEIGDPRREAVPYLIDSLVYDNPHPEVWAYHHDGCNCSPNRAILMMYGRRRFYTYPTEPLRSTYLARFSGVNPAVLDTLVKISDQKYPGYGSSTDNWRRWWVADKMSHEAHRHQDRVISRQKPDSSPDSSL